MNGTYLSLLIHEIREDIHGQCIEHVLIKGRLVQLVFDSRALYISMYPDALGLFVGKKTVRSYALLQNFDHLLRGQCIRQVLQEGLAPVMHIETGTHHRRPDQNRDIVVTLYTQAPNMIIREAGKSRKLYPRVMERSEKPLLWDAPEHVIESLLTGPAAGASMDIMESYEGIDRFLAGELTPERIARIRAIMHGEKARPRLVGVCPLRISLFAERYEKEYASFNVLLQDAISSYLRIRQEATAVAQKKKAVRNLQRRIMRLKKKLHAPAEIERYRQTGNCILANLQRIHKGDAHVVLDDPSTGVQYEVTLDRSKSPQENAQAYFRRYKKLKRGQPHLQEKLRSLEEELARIQQDAWVPMQDTATGTKESRPSISPYRVFALDSGAVVYAGRNARSNESLTFSFARPHDYFFHVRGYQGSHVILRTGKSKRQKVSGKDIASAAAIAAFYSKAKTQKRIPVSYTQRKYLKKARKGPPGAVILMREEVVFVDPELPSEGTD
jgi:hypothetical protein